MATVRSGKLFFKVNGTRYRAKGAFSYNIGADKTTKILGSDEVHGDKVMPTISFLEGKITDGDDIDLKLLAAISGTATLQLSNGKTVAFFNVVNGADINVDSDEGEIPIRLEADYAEEVA